MMPSVGDFITSPDAEAILLLSQLLSSVCSLLAVPSQNCLHYLGTAAVLHSFPVSGILLCIPLLLEAGEKHSK